MLTGNPCSSQCGLLAMMAKRHLDLIPVILCLQLQTCSLSLSLSTVKEGTVFGGTAEIRGDSSLGPISEDDLRHRHRPSFLPPFRLDDDGATKCAITEDRQAMRRNRSGERMETFTQYVYY